jgi:hypothetical protein
VDCCHVVLHIAVWGLYQDPPSNWLPISCQFGSCAEEVLVAVSNNWFLASPSVNCRKQPGVTMSQSAAASELLLIVVARP